MALLLTFKYLHAFTFLAYLLKTEAVQVKQRGDGDTARYTIMALHLHWKELYLTFEYDDAFCFFVILIL